MMEGGGGGGNGERGRRRGRTSGGDEVSVGDEQLVSVVFLQDVRQDLQGEAFLLPGLLAPLVWVHLGVGQVRIIVLVVWRETHTQM